MPKAMPVILHTDAEQAEWLSAPAVAVAEIQARTLPADALEIVSDDEAEIAPLRAALSAASDPSRKYFATVLGTRRAAEIPWESAALVVWHAPIPAAARICRTMSCS